MTVADSTTDEVQRLRDQLAAARGDAEANRVCAEQHPGLLDRIHTLEEELFDERLAFAKLKEEHDQTTDNANLARTQGQDVQRQLDAAVTLLCENAGRDRTHWHTAIAARVNSNPNP